MSNLPILVVLCPLVAALTIPCVSYINKGAAKITGIGMSALALILAAIQAKKAITTGTIRYFFGNWKAPLGIEFSIDSINSVIVVLICFMGFLSMVFSMSFVKDSSRFKTAGYYSVLSLLITGLIGMTSTGDVFNLYVFLEITSLSGYGLIAMGGDKGVLSSFRYLLIGTIGASFYLLGTAFLYGETGTLNMEDMSGLVGPVLSSGTTMVAMAFFIIGFGIKMALFPLHGWQPAAYTNAHPGAAPLIAGVMGKIPAYAMLRFFFFVFNANNLLVENFLIVVGVMSSIGIVYGSIMAIGQKDIRKMFAYSSIAQVGYIGMGMAIGNVYGLLGAIMHIINHSFMKGGLFFCCGAIKYKYGITRIDDLGQIYKKMPKTVAVVVVSALSMVGLPPLAGFFSKWYLALGAAQEHQYIYIGILVVSSLLNAVYFFRLIEKIFMKKPSEKLIGAQQRLQEDQIDAGACKELPLSMLFSICICGIGVIVLGLCNTWVVDALMEVVMGVA